MDKETLTAQLDRMKYLYDETEKLKKVCEGLHSITDRGAFVSPEYFNELVEELDSFGFKKPISGWYKVYGKRNGMIYRSHLSREQFNDLVGVVHEDNE